MNIIKKCLDKILNTEDFVKSEDSSTTFNIPAIKSSIKDESNDGELSSTTNESKTGTDKYVNSRIQESASYTNHLSNVISGINHEISPWLGNILNIISRVKTTLPLNCEKCYNVQSKLDQAIFGLKQSMVLMETLSSNVKLLKNHSLTEMPLIHTIDSWVKVTLLDRMIKEMIHEDNIEIVKDSLNFSVKHSPMFVAQIIHNLVKNSIDHNTHMLDTLKLKIYGKPSSKTLVYQDNGKGIDPSIQARLFTPGITTKDDKPHQHGLGLSACMDYCLMMGATMKVKSVPGKTKFYIMFEKSYERLPSNDEWVGVKEVCKEKIRIQKQIESGGYSHL